MITISGMTSPPAETASITVIDLRLVVLARYAGLSASSVDTH
jgi:hypothetical protein